MEGTLGYKNTRAAERLIPVLEKQGYSLQFCLGVGWSMIGARGVLVAGSFRNKTTAVLIGGGIIEAARRSARNGGKPPAWLIAPPPPRDDLRFVREMAKESIRSDDELLQNAADVDSVPVVDFVCQNSEQVGV